METHRGPQLHPLGHGHRVRAAHGPDQGHRLGRGAGAGPDAHHPGHARPRRPGRWWPASREAWGPGLAGPVGPANSSWRWQWESNHSITASCTGPTPASSCAGGRGERPFRRRGPRGSHPRQPDAGSRWSAGDPSRPMRRQISSAVDGMAGTMRMATMRSTSRALPRMASTAGPGLGLPRLGRLQLGVGLPDEPPGRLESEVGQARVPRRRGLGDHRGRHAGQAAVRVGGRTDPPALGADHGGHPGQEVAEVVGQVGVVAG